MRAGITVPGKVHEPNLMRKTTVACSLTAILTLAAVAPSHGQSAFSNAVTALNPVAYWPLTESTAPPGSPPVEPNLGSAGAAYNATYNNNVTFGADGALAGSGDTAADFDGASASATPAYGSALAIGPSFTVEAWLKSENIGATQCALADVDGASPRSGWLIYMDISNPGQYTARFYNQNGTTPSLAVNIGDPSSIAAGQWYHLALVVSNAVTATNVYGYLNGVLVAGPTALPSFVPNDGVSGATFSIGDRSDNSFYFDGDIDEVAYYPSALDANVVASHYNTGSTSPATGYSALVLASNPSLYYRMDAAASPVAHNYGSLGAAANGYYQSGTAPGVAGPSFGAFGNGFGSDNFATQFSSGGTQSSGSGPTVNCAFADPSVLNITNSVTVAGWVKVPTGAVGWFTGVLGRGDNSYRFAVDTTGFPHFANGGNGNGDIVGENPVNDGKWHYWVGTYDSASGAAVLYIDSVSSGTATWVAPPGDTDRPFLIGGAPDYAGRNFVGEVAQVAIFNSALSVAQIQGLYNATAPSPYDLAVANYNPVGFWPLSETATPPAVATFSATNLGTVGSALNGTFNGDVIYGFPGALASSDDSADEFNCNSGAGGVTSLVTPYTADIANGPSFTIEAWLNAHYLNTTQCAMCDMDAASPRSGWLLYMDISNPGQYTWRGYAQNGTTPALAVNIGGASSIAQDTWNHVVVVVSNAITATNVYGYLNGVLVAGPTALPAYVPNDGLGSGTFSIGMRSDSSFWFDGAIDEVAYYTNALDATAIAAHYAAATNPAPATAYKQLVLQQKPIVYFQMDEAPAGQPYPLALPVAANYGSSGAEGDGYYESGVTTGAQGPFGANSKAAQFAAGAPGPAGTAGPGVLCAPYDFAALAAHGALTLSAWVQVPTTPASDTFETVIGASDGSYRFDVDASFLPHFAAAPNGDLVGTQAINDGAWHLWTGVYDPVAGKGYLYIDGLVVASAPWSALSGYEDLLLIGGAPDYGGSGTRVFNGSIADVALLTNALTQAQIQATYASIGVPPSPPKIVQQPAPAISLFSGETFSDTVAATGPGTLSYQWFIGTNAVAGATSATLSLAGVGAANAGSYTCVVSNKYGAMTSGVTVLTIVSTHADEYDAAVVALNPIAFYPLNETSGTTAFEYVMGNNGTYENNATNDQPGVTNPPFEGFPATDFSAGFNSADTNSFISAPFGTLSASATETIPNVSFTCWINPSGQQNDSLGLIFDRGGAVGGLDMGQGTSSQMLGYTWNNNNANTYNFVSGLTPPQGEWSFVGLTISPTAATLYLYTTNSRGSAVNEIAHSEGALDGAWRIGNDAAGDPTRTFNGTISAVAIFPSTLTQAQMNSLFDTGAYGTTNVAPIVTLETNEITVDLGGSGTITSIVTDGTAPLSYQWEYVSGGVTNKITGATNAVLTLTDIQSAQSGYQYQVLVSNAFGVGYSPTAALNILSGPPVVVQDISPLLTVVPAGLPVTLGVMVTGTEPFTYQWSSGAGPIANATNVTYSFNALAGTNTYTLSIHNSAGSASSSTATVIGVTTAPPVVSFNGNGTGWTLNQGSSWPGGPNNPNITGNVLQLTDGTNGEACSAFFDTPQYVGGFFASYVYQVQPASSVADGTVFCLQDNTNSAFGLGVHAVGNGGGDLAFNGLSPSVGFEMNVYTGANGGVGIEFGTNGLTADSTPALSPYGPTAPVNIGSFDPINVQLYYSQNVLNVVLQDGKLLFTTNYYCDIPFTLGSESAYVGFTSSDGGVNSVQTVSDFKFSYSTGPLLTVKPGVTAGTAVVSWAVSVSTLFTLQESDAVTGPWSNVTTTPTVVNGENQVTLTPSGNTAFYRLIIQ